MNTKNKILKVLEKVPSGTKLYSTAFGNLELESIVEAFGDKRIKLMEENRNRRIYLPDGRYKKGGEVTLYPSREIRDWDKFAWKKGDVLTNNKGAFCIFKEFSGYPYTNFVAIFVHIAGVSTSDSAVEITQEWHKASGENAGKYIKLINTNLEKENKRLNLKTLEIERPEFRDGDILTCPPTPSCRISTFIFKGENVDGVDGYAYYAAVGGPGKLCISTGNTWCGKSEAIRYATEEEKQKLFNTLTKECKRWNVEKKVIEDIKPEHELKPFQKVLVRDDKADIWKPDLFGLEDSTKENFRYMGMVAFWKYCIPYEGNEHLLGTSKDPEEK